MGSKIKTLHDLGLKARNGANPELTHMTVDSREVKEETLFAALPGTRVHGAEFIQYAVRMDVSAVLTDAAGAEIAKDIIGDVPLVVTEDPRQALAYASALWFGAQPGTMIAVTGTNGKTSVSTFARMIWTELGFPAVNLGTTGVEGAYTAPLMHTTPEPITLHKTLADAQAAGITHAAMEASSHGLAQRRLDGVQLMAAGFTNFTQDHLDYHDSFDDYFDAKAGLFRRVLPQDGTAVLNIDDPKGQLLATECEGLGQKTLTVGRAEGADLHILGQRYDATGQDVMFTWDGASHQTRLNLIGGFQAENVLLAAGLVIACGAAPNDVFDALPHLSTVRGRMQLAATRANGATIFVDYAHTPDAIATALKAMRPHVMGRLISIVGAGGDRDTGKRILMGQAAAADSDVVFVTDDNPRSEDPSSIRAMVLEGAPEATEVADRAEAILRGVDALQPGDALLIAGKGHETGQTVGDTVFPFDDVEQASVAVAALDGGLI